jgi:hypothetical protein
MKRCREVNIRKFAPGKRPINNWPREFIFINYAGGFLRTYPCAGIPTAMTKRGISHRDSGSMRASSERHFYLNDSAIRLATNPLLSDGKISITLLHYVCSLSGRVSSSRILSLSVTRRINRPDGERLISNLRRRGRGPSTRLSPIG